MSQAQRLLLTPGEPAGIGPELCLFMAQENWPVELLAIADPKLLIDTAEQIGLAINIKVIDRATPPEQHQAGELKVLPVSMPEPATAGELNTANGAYVVETLALAADCLLSGDAQGLVTAPVHKGVINDAGVPFTGHTEFFAERAGVSDVVMMLAHDAFRVALVTTHLPLRAVADAITDERLERVIRIVDADLRTKFHIDKPVIHVCGLNPHAGEGGHLGREEIEIIEPVLERLINEGLNLKGPLPADTALTLQGIKGADASIAMYHDQGLPVLKYAGFGAAVNITLGLPFIRVSVDHGTALDIAGKGIADLGSMKVAMQQALIMMGVQTGG